MRTERLLTSTPELDGAEVDWWNRFSPISERLWTLDPELSRALRSRYLRRAAAHLRAGPRRNGAILDLGCGSGLTSRFLAEQGLEVVGVDISEAQVEAAREIASSHPRRAAMSFRVADANELSESGERFDGVVAHAFLHHLAADELAVMMSTIARLLHDRGRVWLYEPVFMPTGSKGLAGWAKALERGAFDLLRRALDRTGQLDRRLVAALARFDAEATERGYFLSPKEVPFTVQEFERTVGEHFQVDGFRWETTASHQLAVIAELLRRPGLRAASLAPVRMAALLDDALPASRGLEIYRGLSGYGFAAAFARASA